MLDIDHHCDEEYIWLRAHITVQILQLISAANLLERCLQMLTEVFPRWESTRTNKFHIIFGQGVWNDEMGFISIFQRPVRKIIGIRVGIIFEATGFNDELSRIHVRL